MHLQQKIIVIILISISIVGIIAIPIGNPKFVTNAIALESAFIVLAILSSWRLKYTVVPNIIIAIIVIIGNTVSPKHTEIMNSFEPFANAVVLIIGGYLLQGLLLITNIMVVKNRKYLRSQTK